jgi:alanine-synthesizing transaminase
MTSRITVSPADLPLQCLYRWERERANATYMTQPMGGGEVLDITWAEAAQQVRRMANWLQQQGWPAGSRVAILGKNSAHWILSDLAYSELYYDGNPTRSILEVPGAKDVAVEFTSMSKTYSMAGWRVGFAVGNKKLIAALTRVKSYLDYGAFTPIQAAACAALNGPQDIVEMNRNLYQKRRDVMVEAFGRAGWDIPSPKASMFAWAPLPPALKEMGSLEFSKQLLTHAEVAVAPGVGYGEDGEGFVRIAMVENEQRLRQAARNIKRYLSSMGVNAGAA